MSTLRISDAPLIPDVDGTEKIPTGGRGDYAISVDQIKDHIFEDVGKELVGLGNVDNTSDIDKPVSTAQQAALNLKADKTYVDNNLDLKADKTNVYTRSETTLALSKKADLVNGVVPENQIPSSFNDVLEFTTPSLPIIGESGKIYVTTDNNKTWRWSGNKYVEISGWNPDSVSKVVTLPTYYTKEVGVDPVTGVADGAYFNVRSSSDDSYVDEYQNIGGVPTPSGKSYPSSNAKWDAIQVVDGDKNQHEINAISKSVVNVAELRNLRGVKNGDTVRTMGHTKIGLGGGTYTFEALSSKTDNNGSYIASSVASGTWVLISKLHFENFGVINDETDQSAKIQNAINFILENKIKLIEFEKPNEYAISKHVSFYQEAVGVGQLPSRKIIVKFNGARLRLLTDNQVGIEVARDFIRIENPSLVSDKAGCVGIHNGLVVENNDTSLRRSSQFMELISPCTEFLDTAVKFLPNKTLGEGWGSYYHTIIDHSFRSTKIGFDFAECPSADNTTTRVRVFGGNHVGGSSTFLCSNVETLTAIGFASEMLLTPDDRLPDSAACTIYMPSNPDNAETVNGYSVFDGTSENCTRHYNVNGAEVDVLGRYLGSSDPYNLSMLKSNGVINTRGTDGSLLAVGRSSDPNKAPKLLLRRYRDSSPNGGSTFSVFETTDGSGFRLDADSDHENWKGEFQLNFDRLTAPDVIKPRTASEDQIQFKNKLEDKFFRVLFTGDAPTLWGGASWNIHGFNVNPLLDNTTSLGSESKRYSIVNTKNINIFPDASVSPTAIGQMTFELTSDTQLKIKVKGNDGVVRSATLTLV